MRDGKRSAPREVEIVHERYQPSKPELKEDLRVDAMFGEAVAALARPVRIQPGVRPQRREPCGR